MIQSYTNIQSPSNFRTSACVLQLAKMPGEAEFLHIAGKSMNCLLASSFHSCHIDLVGGEETGSGIFNLNLESLLLSPDSKMALPGLRENVCAWRCIQPGLRQSTYRCRGSPVQRHQSVALFQHPCSFFPASTSPFQKADQLW